VQNSDTIGSITDAGTIDIASDVTLTVGNNTTATTFSGTIIGNGGFTKIGSATLTLSGANTFRGDLQISAGTLTLADNDTNILPDRGNIILDNTAGVVLNINGKAETIGNLSGGGANGGNITLGDGTLTLNTRTNSTYGGIISGTGALVKNGVAAQTLSGQSTYQGGTTINAGQLKSNTDNAILSTGALTLTSTAEFIVNSGVSQTIGNLTSSSTNSNINLIGTGALTVTQTSNTTYAGVIEGRGTLTKAGAAVLTLSNNNTYIGNTTVSAGTLKITGTLSNLNNVIVNGGTYDVSANDTVKSIAGSGGIIDIADGITLIENSRVNKTYQGAISGSGTLSKAGAGALTLSGTNSVSNISISAGQLKVSGTLSDSAAITVGTGASYIVQNSDTIGSIADAGTIDIASDVTLTVGNNTTATTFSGTIIGNGGFTKIGSATLTLSGANTFRGDLQISAGTLTLADNDTNILPDRGNIILDNTAGVVLNINGKAETIGNLSEGGANGGNITLGDGTLTLNTRTNSTYGGIISGTGALVKNGVAAQTLSGQSTYQGGTTINAGQLKSNTDNAILSTGALTLTSTAEFIVNSGVSQTIGNLTSSSTNSNINLIGTGALTVTQTSNTTYAGVIEGRGTLTKAGAAVLTLSNNNTYIGNTTVSAGTLKITGTLSNLNNVIVNGGTYDVSANDTVKSIAGSGGIIDIADGITLIENSRVNKTYQGAISGSGTLSKAGAGALTLSGTNSVSNISISAGQLKVSGTLSDSAAITVGTGASYIVQNSDTIGSIADAGTIDIASDVTLTVGNNTTATTFSGTIIGNGGFTKIGSATLTLSGANTFRGDLQISAGTLTLADNDTNILPDRGNIILDNTAGVVLNINGKAETIGNLSGGGANGGNITLGDGTLTLNTRTNSTYGGIISGTGALVKNGVAAQTLSGQSTYQGGTTINAGQLKSNTDNAILSTGALTLTSTAEFIVNSGVSQTIGNLTSSSTNSLIFMVPTSTLTVTQTSNGTYEGKLNGLGSFVKEGSATLILTNSNTNRGSTSINNGVLELGNNSSIGAVTIANIVGATLDIDGGTITTRTFSSAENSIIDFGVNGQLIIYQDSENNFEGTLNGQGTLTKRGNSDLTRLGSTIKAGNSTINN
jgi:fibronectin-binding autotransporter adhesin